MQVEQSTSVDNCLFILIGEIKHNPAGCLKKQIFTTALNYNHPAIPDQAGFTLQQLPSPQPQPQPQSQPKPHPSQPPLPLPRSAFPQISPSHHLPTPEPSLTLVCERRWTSRSPAELKRKTLKARWRGEVPPHIRWQCRLEAAPRGLSVSSTRMHGSSRRASCWGSMFSSTCCC